MSLLFIIKNTTIIIIIIVVITCKSVGTAAIVVSHAINADGAVLAGRRPALVPVRLALTSGVSVYAVARISAALAINQSVVVAMVADGWRRKDESNHLMVHLRSRDDQMVRAGIGK